MKDTRRLFIFRIFSITLIYLCLFLPQTMLSNADAPINLSYLHLDIVDETQNENNPTVKKLKNKKFQNKESPGKNSAKVKINLDKWNDLNNSVVIINHYPVEFEEENSSLESNELISKAAFTSTSKTPSKFTFPKFNDSLMRHSGNQLVFDRLYKYPTRKSSLLELRKAKKSIEAIYDKNRKLFTSETSAPDRIPKIVHQIWLGSEVPEKFAEWMATWANMQGWEYKLWTDDDAKSFVLHNQSLYDEAKNFGEKSDIFRYEILYREGGLYVDVDFENVNPELLTQLNKSFDFYAGIEPMEHRQPINSPLIGNAILASIPGHPILEKIILDMKSYYNRHEKDWAVICTGPVYLTKKIHEYNQDEDKEHLNIILPPTFLFPLSYTDARANENYDRFIKPETVAIHYWSGSWLSDEEKERHKRKLGNHWFKPKH